ncbi:MAG: hypothetical protein P4K83_07755 [Terracidiphilus sp.]|nr:hypothetical protein [Terracidiphilus sp.]
MASKNSVFLRIPLILLAAGDLALLALRLRPWPEIVNLPGQGTTGYDPAICLTTYILLLFWIGGNRDETVQKALRTGLWLAIPAGLLLLGYVYMSAQETQQAFYTQIGFLAGASIFWGIAGMKAAKISKSPNVGIAAGAWSGMISALMGAAGALARIDLNNPLPPSSDPWKQYQGLAIGTQAIQSMVHQLNMTTGFLLIAPLVGGALGLIFSLAVQE